MQDAALFKLAQHERWRDAIRTSERRLMQAICTFEKVPGYTIFRSEEFPNFYAGNGIAIERAQPELTLEDWEAAFKSAFPAETKHITLFYTNNAFSEELQHQAEHRGYNVYREISMAALAVQVAAEQVHLLRPLSMRDPDDREALRLLHLAEAQSQDWYTDEAAFDELFAKTMAVSDRCGVDWIAVPHHNPEQQGRLASALGYFWVDDLCRLQEVITAPDCRKRGYATTLLREVARRAVVGGTEAIGLLAEEEGDGASLYRSLGFRSVGCEVILMLY